MSKTPTTTKLTGRTAMQAQAAHKWMPALLIADSTASTITFNTDPTTLAGAVDVAISEAKAAGQRGDSQALNSLRRLLGAWGMRNSTNATAATKAQAAKVVTNMTAANVADAKEATKAAAKAPAKAKATKAPEADGPKAGRQAAPAHAAPKGYVPTVHLTVAFDVFKAEDGKGYLVRCNPHGATRKAASVGEAITQGRAAQRASWCKRCGNLVAADATAQAGRDSANARKATKAPANAGRKLRAVK